MIVNTSFLTAGILLMFLIPVLSVFQNHFSYFKGREMRKIEEKYRTFQL
jgi:hypothetical protein